MNGNDRSTAQVIVGHHGPLQADMFPVPLCVALPDEQRQLARMRGMLNRRGYSPLAAALIEELLDCIARALAEGRKLHRMSVTLVDMPA